MTYKKEFAEGLATNPTYTPVNFTPTGYDIDGYIEGIDDAFDNIPSGPSGGSINFNFPNNLTTDFSPIALYNFEQGSLNDSSGNNLDLTLEDSPSGFSIVGSDNSSLYFSGTGNVPANGREVRYSDTTTGTVLQNTTQLTVEAVIWVSQVPTTSMSIAEYSAPGETSNTNYLWSMSILSDLSISYFHESGAGTNNPVESVSSVVPTNSWVHLCVTRAANGRDINFYVNGQNVDSGSAANAPTDGTSSIFSIGAGLTGVGTSQVGFGGYIHSVKIIAAELTASQVQQEFQTAFSVIINPTYTPVNFTATSSDIDGYFEGIDEALVKDTLITVTNSSTPTITNNVYNVILVDTSSVSWDAGDDITLPSSIPNSGTIVVIKDSGGQASSKNIDILGNGLNIDGSTSFTLSTNYQSVTLVSDGANWNII